MFFALIARSRVGRAALSALTLLLVCAVARPALAAEQPVHGQGVLWRIERDGLAPSHLFGTIHITDARVTNLPAPVREAFEKSRSATFEVIMTDEVQTKMARAMVLSDGRSLDAIVGPDLFARAATAGRRYGITDQQLRFFKPWALAIIFSVPQAELARNATGDLPLDQALQVEALQSGKPLYALESADEQIAVFNGMSEADQIAMLKSAVDENAAIEQVFEGMVDHYLNRDIAGILDQMAEQAKTVDPRFLELFMLRFNEQRNRKMVDRMAKMLREGGSFIAVGALHLPGKNGLLSLLEKRGYRVARVY